jgi:2-keto-4-pentenoate hydratase/2-oxohepta-3-ene-1,7-dioic acid hydratase in catechol pathway
MATYARFEQDGGSRYGLIANGAIEELAGGLFDLPRKTGRMFAVGEVKLLAPVTPSKVLAIGLNYKSHVGNRPVPDKPDLFYKPITCIQNPGDPIVIPPDASDPHFEGEMVVVISKQLRRASREEAAEAIFGITCGNDVSDRNWQRNTDRQFWRAKGCDTFGPVGPWIVTGLNYSDLDLQTRVNGEVVQHQRTSDLLIGVPEILAYASRYLTISPGDILFTGTPGATKKLAPGDVVEVEIEGVGVLSNPVVAD